MRAIPDINGQRRCRKCEKLLPLSEFSQIPRRHICKLCRARMYKKKSIEKRTVAQTMMANVQWDAKHIFRVPHNLRAHQIPTLPCVAEVGIVVFFFLFFFLRCHFYCWQGTSEARIVPIDYRAGIAAYNGVIVDKVMAKCLHACFFEDKVDLYKVCFLSVFFLIFFLAV